MKNEWMQDIIELKRISYNEAVKQVAEEHDLNPEKLKEILEAKKK